jgi:hypothetical protein
MRTLPCFVCLIAAFALTPFARAADEEGFKPLFDGKTLKGWVGDPRFWSVEDGAIAGWTTKETPAPHNTFLATEKSYKNFILKAEFKLRNHNSGIQVRSKLLPEYVVHGYQPDIAESRYTGTLYEEGGRGTIADVNQEEVKKIYTPGQWTEYTITCDGPELTLALNGHVTARYTEKDPVRGATEGIIALQLHAGPPMKVWFRNIRIKELP